MDDDLYDLATGPRDPHAGPERHTEWSTGDLDFVADDWRAHPRRTTLTTSTTDGEHGADDEELNRAA